MTDLHASLDDFIAALADAVATRVKASLNEGSGLKPRPRLLDVPGAAAYLCRTEKAVYALIANRRIPVVRIDSKPQFDVKDLDKLLEKLKESSD